VPKKIEPKKNPTRKEFTNLGRPLRLKGRSFLTDSGKGGVFRAEKGETRRGAGEPLGRQEKRGEKNFLFEETLFGGKEGSPPRSRGKWGGKKKRNSGFEKPRAPADHIVTETQRSYIAKKGRRRNY